MSNLSHLRQTFFIIYASLLPAHHFLIKFINRHKLLQSGKILTIKIRLLKLLLKQGLPSLTLIGEMKIRLLLLVDILVFAGSISVSYSAPTETPVECAKAIDLDNAELKQSFDSIDDYLVKNVADDDAEVNLEAAKRWLQKELQTNSESKIVEALKLFTSLENVPRKEDCNEKSLEVLMKNDAATDGQALDPTKVGEKLRRIEQVIDFYATKHEDSCLPAVLKSQNTGPSHFNNNNQLNSAWPPQNYPPAYQPVNYPPVNYPPAYQQVPQLAYPPPFIQPVYHPGYQPVYQPNQPPFNPVRPTKPSDASSLSYSGNLAEKVMFFAKKLVKNRLAKKKKKKKKHNYGFGGEGEEEAEEEEEGGFGDQLEQAIAAPVMAELGGFVPEPIQGFANEYGGYFTDPVGTIERDILEDILE